jgi:GntR family transcriptional repressor for pyruvate dehydrogenase complex
MPPTHDNPPRLRSEAVHDRLRHAILSGQLAPGDGLPSERALSETHRVNRHAVREAIKRLQQSGLVQVNHGGATRVLDWREHGGLDPAELREQLPALARAIPDPGDVRRYQRRFECYQALWARIIVGSGNLAYQLALNSLVGARQVGALDPQLYATEVDDPGAVVELADAVAAGDGPRAQALARDLLERTVRRAG